mmetsp:Transcript_10728/g.26941  ORF Transcript_10728/g.26941 Transcript_10728/m.26941 type:complete len:91 (-) Transcript_10728:393-665(-)
MFEVEGGVAVEMGLVGVVEWKFGGVVVSPLLGVLVVEMKEAEVVLGAQQDTPRRVRSLPEHRNPRSTSRKSLYFSSSGAETLDGVATGKV